jgi:hypothetical protein
MDRRAVPRRGRLFVAAPEREQVLLERVEVGEVVGLERFALHDREVDLGLVEPAGVHRGVDEDQVAPGALEAVDRAFAAVRGAVVDDHEHALRFAVGLGAHELVDERVERFDPGHARDLLDDPPRDCLARELDRGPARKRLALLGRQLARQRDHLSAYLWGEKSGAGPASVGPPAQPCLARRTACATVRPPRDGSSTAPRSRRCAAHARQAAPSEHGSPANTATYTSELTTPRLRIAHRSTRCGMDCA